jgi:non-lysosomal glucosylceramidase
LAANWKRPLGSFRLENPGVTRVPGDIDDGYWQGVPVGGLGPERFPAVIVATLRAGISKPRVHKYEPVYANQFAMFQQSEGDATARPKC